MNYQILDTKRLVMFFTFFLGLLLTDMALAGQVGAHYSVGQISNNMVFSVGGLAKLITAGCYVVGFGFGIGAILKYKGYRDNPSQITLSQPVVLALISLAFVFLPMIFVAAGDTIFGTHAVAGGTHGVSKF